MTEKLKWYFLTWWEIISAPILFFTVLETDDWKGKSLDFLTISSWLFSFVLIITIFIVQLFPMGQYLVEGITGFKLLIVMPVVLALALMFSAIIYIILGGFMQVGCFAAFFVLGWGLHLISKYFGGEKDVAAMLQAVFYSVAVLLFFSFTLALAILANFGIISFSVFQVGFNLVYYFSLLFVYGLWSIIVRKVGGHSKPIAFALAAVPFAGLVLFGIIFDLKGFEKIRPILGV